MQTRQRDDLVGDDDRQDRAGADRRRRRSAGGIRRGHRSVLQQPVHDENDRVVLHDRRDHFVHTACCLEPAGDRAPRAACDHRRHERERQQEDPGQLGELRSGPASGKRADEELALRADIEESRAERDRDGDARERERHRDDERLGDVVRTSEGATQERCVAADRVATRDEDEDRTGEQCRQDRYDRHRGTLRPLRRRLTHRRGRSRPRR